MLGAILFGLGALAAWYIYMMAGVILVAGKMFCMLAWDIFLSCYQSIFVKRKLDESGFTEKKLFEQRLEEAAKQRKHDEQILGQHNAMIKATLNAVNEIRIKYPYAAEFLYDEYRKKFASASVKQLKDLEDIIRKSHLDNEISYSLHGKQSRQYTLNDINGLAHIEEWREDPLIMRAYKVDSDYILHINDMDSNAHYLLQSKDYFVIIRTQLKIIVQQKELRKMKQTIKSVEINDIFDNVSSTTQAFRRNRMGFID